MSSRPSALGRGAFAGIACAFVLSGGAALVYQVIWQRVLVLHTGIGVVSMGLIVAAFLAGLGFGSELGGIVSARVTRRTALLLFGALELAVAGCGLVSPYVLYDVLYTRHAGLYTSVGAGAVLHFLVLLVPTGLMGMSLPFLVRAAVADPDQASRTIGRLYGVNVLGAAAGSLLTPWLLVPRYGLRGALVAAAVCNVLAGVAALLVTRAAPPPVDDDTTAGAEAAPDVPIRGWILLYASSGAIAIALEMVWFRITDLAVKSNPLTFGTVLALYLLGLGAGSLAGGRIVARTTQPLRLFLLLQVAILVYAASAVCALAWLPPELPGYDWYVAYWSRPLGLHPGSPAWQVGSLLKLYLIVPLFLFAVPTILMGVSFTVLQKAVHTDARGSGRRVGTLQAANIAGCVAGSLVVGVGLLDVLGTTGTLRVLLLAGLVFVATGARRYGGFRVPAVLLVGLALALPSQQALWSRLHGERDPVDLVDEDATGVAALLPLPSGGWRLFNNGWSHSSLPFGSHTALGLLPSVVHPAPVDIAIVGLGSGDTAWAAAGRRETRSVTVFEVRAGQRPLLERLSAREAIPQLQRFLDDPRITLRIEDGRRALGREDRLYDLIEVDALYPYNAGSGLVYSVEFYEMCARRLKPGGVMCIWTPTSRVTDTFRRVFKTTLMFPEEAILVGSNDVLPQDAAAWQARLRSPELQAYFAPLQPERYHAALGGTVVLGSGKQRPWTLQPPNLDLFPRDEFRR